MEYAVREAEAGGERGGLGLSRVPAKDGEAVGQVAVALDGGLGLALVRLVRHLGLRIAELLADDIKAAGGQHPVNGQDLQVTGARVLRQEAHGAGTTNGARGRLALAGQDL